MNLLLIYSLSDEFVINILVKWWIWLIYCDNLLNLLLIYSLSDEFVINILVKWWICY